MFGKDGGRTCTEPRKFWRERKGRRERGLEGGNIELLQLFVLRSGRFWSGITTIKYNSTVSTSHERRWPAVGAATTSAGGPEVWARG